MQVPKLIRDTYFTWASFGSLTAGTLAFLFAFNFDALALNGGIYTQAFLFVVYPALSIICCGVCGALAFMALIVMVDTTVNYHEFYVLDKMPTIEKMPMVIIQDQQIPKEIARPVIEVPSEGETIIPNGIPSTDLKPLIKEVLKLAKTRGL